MGNFNNHGAPRPPQVMALTLKYKEAQEALLRRLGQAVVLHWDELPDALQDLLIDQAAVVVDRDEAAHESSDIEAFIRGVKSTALPKDAPSAK
jgi:hypothetical protein